MTNRYATWSGAGLAARVLPVLACAFVQSVTAGAQEVESGESAGTSSPVLEEVPAAEELADADDSAEAEASPAVAPDRAEVAEPAPAVELESERDAEPALELEAAPEVELETAPALSVEPAPSTTPVHDSLTATASATATGDNVSGETTSSTTHVVTAWLGGIGIRIGQAEADRTLGERRLGGAAIGAGYEVLPWLRAGLQFAAGEIEDAEDLSETTVGYRGADVQLRMFWRPLVYVSPYLQVSGGVHQARLDLDAPLVGALDDRALAGRVTGSAGVSLQVPVRWLEIGVWYDAGYAWQGAWRFDHVRVENATLDVGGLDVRGLAMSGGVFFRLPLQ